MVYDLSDGVAGGRCDVVRAGIAVAVALKLQCVKLASS